MDKNEIWQDMQRVCQKVPLVYNITNYVVMNTTANALLAIGASPVMAHAIEEVEEMTSHAQALILNIGTLSTPWIDGMVKAGQEARRRKIPVVLDPVGSGATQFRTKTAQMLIREIRPTIIRANASEIKSLAGRVDITKGVDSLHSPDEVMEDALELARSTGCVVSVSGALDLIIEGNSMVRVSNGHPMMSKVTGMGCTASAITGALAAINGSPFKAAAHAMAIMGIAGEIAAERSTGPGSFQVSFLDALSSIKETDINERLKI